jgi:23S rRNA pseudouridine955/2504/2580 synthase
MQKINITSADSGQTLIKFLSRYMKNAPKSFFYKMLRKKNIVLNGKKSDGTDMVKMGDEITLFLSDETIDKFREEEIKDVRTKRLNSYEKHVKKLYGDSDKTISAEDLEVLYEDDDVIFVNKPAGVLSQKADNADVSINEVIIDYVRENDELTATSVKPAICNRLDRNTSGVISAGKSITGLKALSYMFKARSVKKYYRTIVMGKCDRKGILEGRLYKDEENNKVTVEIVSSKESAADGNFFDAFGEGAANSEDTREFVPVKISIEPLFVSDSYSYLEIELITGKSHQIRAQLASIGNPVIGDFKYGNRNANMAFLEKQHGGALKGKIKPDMFLHAYKLVMPEIEELEERAESIKLKLKEIPDVSAAIRTGEIDEEDMNLAGVDWKKLEEISGWDIIAPLPDYFKRALEIIQAAK